MIISVLTLYDLPLLIGLLSILKLEYLLIVSPLIIIIHLWSVRLLIKNPYSTQFEMILFLGVFGLIGSLTLYFMVLGLSYYVLSVTSIYFYFFITLSLVILSYLLVKYQIDKYSKDPLQKPVSQKQSKYLGVAILAPAIGYILGQSVQDTLILKHLIAVIVMYFFVLFNVYIAAKFLHRFFFMKANMDYVTFQKPSKKEKKELNKKGVVIK